MAILLRIEQFMLKEPQPFLYCSNVVLIQKKGAKIKRLHSLWQRMKATGRL